jgi:hypothetical protein
MFTYISNETGKVIRNVNTENKLANTELLYYLYISWFLMQALSKIISKSEQPAVPVKNYY